MTTNKLQSEVLEKPQNEAGRMAGPNMQFCSSEFNKWIYEFLVYANYAN